MLILDLTVPDKPKKVLGLEWKSAGLKCRSQVTGQVTGQITGHRPQARLQVTGHRPGHRPQVRSQVRSQVTHKNNRALDKTVLDWHFIIQSQGTSIIFFLF